MISKFTISAIALACIIISGTIDQASAEEKKLETPSSSSSFGLEGMQRSWAMSFDFSSPLPSFLHKMRLFRSSLRDIFGREKERVGFPSLGFVEEAGYKIFDFCKWEEWREETPFFGTWYAMNKRGEEICESARGKKSSHQLCSAELLKYPG